jgi:predicted ATPase/DNA-binding SARP family transcriptional activator
VRFRVLGSLDVVIDGRVSVPAGARERVVLARLLLDAGRSVATDALLETAWPGMDPARAGRSLHVRLAHLRGFLEPGRPAGAPSSLLVREGAGYRLAIDPDQVDAVRFERLVRAAGSLPAADAFEAYVDALALWRGRPFSDIPDDEFVQIEVRRLEELRAHAAVARARALVELGRHEEALPELHRLASENGLDEELARTLALALYRAGRQVEALDALRELGGLLRELGLEPSAETRELERRILLHDAGLAAPGPAMRAAAAALALPRRVSRFFGREAHLAHAGELIREGALVTIVGVGGAGKTRLALELAERERGEWMGGPWWCELAPVADDGDVAGAVASALGVESGGVDGIAEHFASREGLLVLDNCEHVLEGVGAVVESLLGSCPGLMVVATSRAPLGVDGEQALRLSGLDLPAGHAPDAADAPAVALFLERARAAGGVIDEDADLGAIAELCRRLDGLPLAIELAAGRTRSLSPREIAARLDERLTLLSVSGRRAAARHRTLRAAIDWSYRLLDDAQRRLFERLSVFARGYALVDVESVCAGDGVDRAHVSALLDELVANSLVTATTANGRTLYRLLETLREYATERLEARGETGAMRDRHVDHYVRSALEQRHAGWRQATLPFVEEFDELRTAVRWCLARDPGPDRAFVLAEALWWRALARHGEEIARLCDDVLDRWPDHHPWRPRALGAASVARLVIGDAATARRQARDALRFEQPDDEPALLAYRTLAQLAFFSRDPAEALRLWREQGTLARAAGHDMLGCEADGFVVQSLQATGDASAANALAERMRDEADRLGFAVIVDWSRYVSGVAVIESNPDQARYWLDEALARSRAADHHHMTRFSLRALGIAATMHGDHAEAARRLTEALEHDEATADAASQWTTLLAFGVLLARLERHEPAAELLAAAHDWPAAPFLTALATRERERIARALDADTLAAAEQRGRTADLGDAKRRAQTALATAAASS